MTWKVDRLCPQPCGCKRTSHQAEAWNQIDQELECSKSIVRIVWGVQCGQVPERVWALRNVSATAAMGGPSGAARAVQLLDKALALKEEWVGSPEHPSASSPGLHSLQALVGQLNQHGPSLRALA